MPRSTIGNRRSAMFDKALELRDYNAAAAVSATTAETAIAFDGTKFMDFKAVVNVAAHTGFVATSAQWEIVIEVSATSSGTYTKVGSAIPSGTAANLDIPLSGQWIEDLLSTAAYIRARAVKTGSPGNLTYGVHLTTSS
jgi:hypothetical protein